MIYIIGLMTTSGKIYVLNLKEVISTRWRTRGLSFHPSWKQQINNSPLMKIALWENFGVQWVSYSCPVEHKNQDGPIEKQKYFMYVIPSLSLALRHI